jgi:hypothetical protein
MDPVPDSLLLRKFGSAGSRTQDLWVSSRELSLLDHRGGRRYKRIRQYIGVASGIGGLYAVVNLGIVFASVVQPSSPPSR